MKKFIALLFVFVFMFTINVSASDSGLNADVDVQSNAVYEYFDDGSYLVTELKYIQNADVSQTGSKASGNYTVSGEKSAIYYNGDDEVIWKVTLTGSFLIVPSNSLESGDCQSATLTYKINDSAWHIYDIVEQVITNNACGFCTMKRKFLGVTTKTVDVDLYITCDYAGNLT